jgi:hypothetical protein
MANFDLNKLKDTLARESYGITKEEALRMNICIDCKKTPLFYSQPGIREYRITGLCEFCFDLTCDPEICQICSKPESFHTYKVGRGECEEFRPKPSEAIGD